MFGFDSSMIQTLEYSKKIDEWWGSEGKEDYTKKHM